MRAGCRATGGRSLLQRQQRYNAGRSTSAFAWQRLSPLAFTPVAYVRMFSAKACVRKRGGCAGVMGGLTGRAGLVRVVHAVNAKVRSVTLVLHWHLHEGTWPGPGAAHNPAWCQLGQPQAWTRWLGATAAPARSERQRARSIVALHPTQTASGHARSHAGCAARRSFACTQCPPARRPGCTGWAAPCPCRSGPAHARAPAPAGGQRLVF